MPVKSHLACTPPSVGACEITRCRTLSRRTLNYLQRKQHKKSCLFFVRAQDPSQPALVPCMLSTVDKRGRTECRLKQTHIHIHTDTLIQHTLPWYAIRYEEAFFPWKAKKRRLALRVSRTSLLATEIYSMVSGTILFAVHFLCEHAINSTMPCACRRRPTCSVLIAPEGTSSTSTA